MSSATPAIRELARRLVAIEAAHPIQTGICGLIRVCEKFRVPLVKLAGIAGFRSLLSRAAALAKAEESSLNSVQVQPDGSLTGMDEISNDKAGIVVVAQLVGLLVTFIGEPLTLGLVRDAWPNETVPELDTASEEGQ